MRPSKTPHYGLGIAFRVHLLGHPFKHADHSFLWWLERLHAGVLMMQHLARNADALSRIATMGEDLASVYYILVRIASCLIGACLFDRLQSTLRNQH